MNIAGGAPLGPAGAPAALAGAFLGAAGGLTGGAGAAGAPPVLVGTFLIAAEGLTGWLGAVRDAGGAPDGWVAAWATAGLVAAVCAAGRPPDWRSSPGRPRGSWPDECTLGIVDVPRTPTGGTAWGANACGVVLPGCCGPLILVSARFIGRAVSFS